MEINWQQIIENSLSNAILLIIAGGLLTYFFNKRLRKFEGTLKQKELINQEKWLLKKNACLNALMVADAILSNYEYEKVQKEDIKPGKMLTEEARKCFNDLACTCESNEVITELKKIMFGKVKLDAIVDLRNAARRELGFGSDNFDQDRETAFVGRINADPELKNKNDLSYGEN